MTPDADAAACGGTEQPPGLRERKRLATRRRIIAAARRGALEDGIDAVTIESIARAADVSPRSFFNYFPTKEAAIVGTRGVVPEPMSDQDLDALPEDLADAVATIVTSLLAGRLDDPYDEDLRVVLRRFPQLLDISRSQWKGELGIATDTVARLLERRGSGGDGAVAPTLVAMCVASIKAGLPTAGARDAGDASRIGAIGSVMRTVAALVRPDGAR